MKIHRDNFFHASFDILRGEEICFSFSFHCYFTIILLKEIKSKKRMH